MSDAAKKKLHYAWFILAICVIVNMVVQSLVMQLSNLFIVPMYKDLQVPRTLLSLQSICMTVSAVISAPFWGKLYKTKNARHLMPLAIIGTGLCSLARSVCPNIWLILAQSLVKGFFFTGSTLLPISILLTVWFKKSRGLAVSIATIGTSAGAAILSPLVSSWITGFGWRGADRIVGLCVIVCGLLVYPVVRSRPKEIGLLPYGATPEDAQSAGAAQKKAAQGSESGMSVSEARKTPQLYLLLLSIFCMTIATGAALQLPTYLMDIGYDSTVAAKAVSGYMTVAIAGKLLLGYITDKMGIKFGTVYSCGVAILAFVCFILAGSSVGFYGLIVFYGLATGITAVMPALLTSRIFGQKDYAPIYGMVVSVNRFGGGVGTLLVSFLYDITKSYSIIWPVCVAAMIFCMIALLASMKMSDRYLKAAA